MSVQTEIDRIITAVGAAYDAVEAKGGTLPTSETVANLAEAISSIPKETHQGSTSETWVLNNTVDCGQFGVEGLATNFISNSQRFIGLFSRELGELIYNQGEDDVSVFNEENSTWIDTAYRKLIFDEAPTGDILEWLEANGVKQPANLAVQPSKDVTVTSNGTTEITPDAPYDVMEKTNVTVDVPTGGGGNIDALIDRTIQEITSNASKVGGSVFKDCFSLTTVNLPKATSIGSQAFFNCSSLTALVLSNTEEVCTLGSNALLGSLIASKTGYIYVPDALVSSYKTATNWKAYASQIKPLSEYSA